MKSIILIAFLLLGCVAFNEALKCYSHDACSANCPQLNDAIKTCEGDNDKCYKGAFAVGVTRGCAKDRCNVQINGNSVVASLCCDTDLCNSAIKFKLEFSTLLMIVSVFILTRM